MRSKSAAVRSVTVSWRPIWANRSRCPCTCPHARHSPPACGPPALPASGAIDHHRWPTTRRKACERALAMPGITRRDRVRRQPGAGLYPRDQLCRRARARRPRWRVAVRATRARTSSVVIACRPPPARRNASRSWRSNCSQVENVRGSVTRSRNSTPSRWSTSCWKVPAVSPRRPSPAARRRGRGSARGRRGGAATSPRRSRHRQAALVDHERLVATAARSSG